MDNLHFSDEFLNFPMQTDADIHADVLGSSTQFHCDFPHDSAWKNLNKQEFHTNLCGKWNPVDMYVRSCTVPLRTLATHFLHKRRRMTWNVKRRLLRMTNGWPVEWATQRWRDCKDTVSAANSRLQSSAYACAFIPRLLPHCIDPRNVRALLRRRSQHCCADDPRITARASAYCRMAAFVP